MNWYRNPSAIEQLAAAYVAGTLRGPARRRFESAMQTQAALVAAVNDWTQRLGPLHQALPEQAPSAALWSRIAKATSHRVPPAAAPAWWRRLLAPAPAGSLVVGLLVVLAGIGPMQDSFSTLLAQGFEFLRILHGGP